MREMFNDKERLAAICTKEGFSRCYEKVKSIMKKMNKNETILSKKVGLSHWWEWVKKRKNGFVLVLGVGKKKMGSSRWWEWVKKKKKWVCPIGGSG